ncbi:MAG TPA: acetoacetate--CoA ligase [Actinomycetes bacterium]|nr:acetoacetate--CoA ligase [Actinomycetes bacterium]
MATPAGSGAAAEPEPLWVPAPAQVERSNLARYRRWLARSRGLELGLYDELWRWSVTDLDGFWGSLWDWFPISGSRADATALADPAMPGTRWFPGARLSYAEHALLRGAADRPALIAGGEGRGERTLTYAELRAQVGAAAAGLRRLGVTAGDRVAAWLPNVPEAVVALLATASLGAVWSSCAPEFGVASVIDRFAQIRPKVLLAVEGYRYGGRRYDRSRALADIRAGLPGLKATVLLPAVAGDAEGTGGGGRAAVGGPGRTLDWAELVAEPGPLRFERVAFDHPLWVLYSSGTTGLPKPIVHGHGGILLEHLKHLTFHLDLGQDDRLFWFTTTGWMMWNFLVGGLLAGATVLLWDGSPAWPDLTALWRFAERTRMTYFGTSAAFVQSCMKAGIRPGGVMDLSRLRGIGSTGSPLSAEGFRWLHERVGPHAPVGSMSGGTDVCTAFVGACPVLPVHAGEIQCRTLGAKVEAFDERGRPVLEQVGELVLTRPLPSMPVGFWGDPDGSRLRASYFGVWPGVWRHGDWVRITRRGGCVISGRSDSTLNRGGVRMGTAEFYRVVEGLDEIADSLVVDTAGEGERTRLLLFVVPAEGVVLDEPLRGRLRAVIRDQLSPRHVPDDIVAVGSVPRTLSGKKLEVPVKRILAGVPVDQAVSEGALANPDALARVVALARGGRA